LLNALPESPKRDLRELELRQSVVRMLQLTRGYSASETIDANEYAAALAERSGNLKQLVNLLAARCGAALNSGDIPAAGTLADQVLEIAIREGCPMSLGIVHSLQIFTHYARGDLAGAEKHFTARLKFFDDAGFRQVPGLILSALGTASLNAWMLGRADLARERIAQVMAAANPGKPYDVVLSGFYAASLSLFIREYEQAQALAARTLELAQKHQFPYWAALSGCYLGHARVQLGRTTEGSGLIRQGIVDSLEIGMRVDITSLWGT
jgi:hypothetical protein